MRACVRVSSARGSVEPERADKEHEIGDDDGEALEEHGERRGVVEVVQLHHGRIEPHRRVRQHPLEPRKQRRIVQRPL
jgi:hypothetical protein